MKSLLQIARRMMATGVLIALGGQALYAQDAAETVYDYAMAHHKQEMTRCETCSSEQFAAKTYKIGFVLEGLGHPHLVALKADAEAVAAKYPNMQLMVRAGGDDLAKQSADAEELLAQGVDALIIQSANAQMLKGVLEQADAMNVPYFFCLKGIKGTKAVSHALAGYSIEGKMMGDYIADLPGRRQCGAHRRDSGRRVQHVAHWPICEGVGRESEMEDSRLAPGHVPARTGHEGHGRDPERIS